MNSSFPLLHAKNGFVRKLAALVGKSIQPCAKVFANQTLPFYLANSFPKSGTHLLDQVVASFPHAFDFGRFLSSMTSSFRFSERSQRATLNFLRRSAPGELIRAHLFHSNEYESLLGSSKAIHFFIYRDLRDVAVSEAFYLRDMNRWHRLHPFFRGLSNEKAIELAILGLSNPNAKLYYPDIASRFRRYMPWLNSRSCVAVRFENLVGSNRREHIEMMVRSVYERLKIDMDERAIDRAIWAIDPKKSHTFRKAQSSGWKSSMSGDCQRLFKEVAGDLLIDLEYETNANWC